MMWAKLSRRIFFFPPTRGDPVRTFIMTLLALAVAVLCIPTIAAAHPGDANRDGTVGLIDLGVIAANWNQSGRSWAQGDFSGDGSVTLTDLGALAANWGWTCPTLSVGNVSQQEANSGTTAFNFSVTLSAASDVPISVNYATADGTATAADNDYTPTSGTLTIPIGQTSGTITVYVNGDTKVETNETFQVNLSNAGPAGEAAISAATGTGTILNDDLLTLSIGNVSQQEANSGTTAFNFPVTLSAACDTAVTVDYATADGTATAADNDYTPTSGTLTIPIGQTSGTITVYVNGDTKVEMNETFQVNLSNAAPTSEVAIGVATGTGTILNDDLPTLRIMDFSANEGHSGQTPFNFSVILSAPTSQDVTVHYWTADQTATVANNDYTAANGTLTIPSGQSGGTITVYVNGDTAIEPNEQFYVTLDTITGATFADNQAMGTIANDDPPSGFPAFPGAEGYGCLATGGRCGTVYKVTNLNNSGAGSFRTAVKHDNGTVIFDTGGTVELSTRLNVYNSNVTIAGQTAPGGGFCVRNGVMYVRNFQNWIIRHMRFRLGRHAGTHDGSEPEFDSMTVTNAVNLIVDHCSFSWGCDENLDVKDLSNNVTIQWCILTEPLNWYGHGYDLILEPNGIANTYMTLHHNLFANQLGRNPRGCNEYGAILWENINNVAYNWGITGDKGAWAAIYAPNEQGDLNWVNNYSIAGPNTTSGASTMLSSGTTGSRIYIGSGNRDTDHDGVAATWSNVAGTKTQMSSPFSVPATYQVTTDSADTAYTNVLAGAGATKPARDSVDTRAVNSVTNRNGSIVNDEDDVGGWPTLDVGTAPTDTDGDGMPDAWESANGTNPNVADNNGDLDADGYTNLEEYINSL